METLDPNGQLKCKGRGEFVFLLEWKMNQSIRKYTNFTLRFLFKYKPPI